MSNPSIAYKDGVLYNIWNKSYYGSIGYISGQEGYLISKEFFMSKDYNKLFWDILHQYYIEEYANFCEHNREGLRLPLWRGSIDFLKTLHDLEFIKYIAKERDGFVNEIILPDVKDVEKFIEQNGKKSDIIFIKYA